MSDKQSVLIVGAGIFGVTAAQELAERGHSVTLIDPGPIPHPQASSTDITKMIRMDYGSDDFYFDLMEAAFQGWDAWNASWQRPLYHEQGFLLMKKTPMTHGSFEMESFKRLQARGHQPERVDSERLAADHPAWNASLYVDGYLSYRAGWAESGQVVAQIADGLPGRGVNVQPGKTFQHFIEDGSRVLGVTTEDGDTFRADITIMATGAWTPHYLPYLSDVMWTTGQPVMHFKPDNLQDYTPPVFRPWSADISQTGWYGFPKDVTGVVKIANHGKGVLINPVDDPHELPPGTEDKFRQFMTETFPRLADAPCVKTRLCLYCDTWDGDFWIDHEPDRPGLVVAAGGSGHGFKFAPVLGGIIADIATHQPNPAAARFAWRARSQSRTEDARPSA